MATVTLYVSSRIDETKLTCATTGQIKKKIKSKLDDSMADEAKICFDFATELFQQMSVSNN